MEKSYWKTDRIIGAKLDKIQIALEVEDNKDNDNNDNNNNNNNDNEHSDFMEEEKDE